MALGSQRADLLPVGNELVSLEVDLRGVLGVSLLQTLCFTTQSVHLNEHTHTQDLTQRW